MRPRRPAVIWVPAPGLPVVRHSLALVRGRQAALDASYPAMTARKEDAVDHNEQEQAASRQIVGRFLP
jgi:hypothetical protein